MADREAEQAYAGAPRWTPGPWWVDNTSPGGGNVVSSRGPVADTLRFGNTHTEAMADYANARLIAAAPELVEALKRALNFIENNESEFGETLECGDLARAALAKAGASQ